ncbi:MAG: cadherin-like domain-containing protein [Verrucomicrobiota bacterium]
MKPLVLSIFLSLTIATVTLAGINVPPTANDDSGSGNEDSAGIVVDVLDNDSPDTGTSLDPASVMIVAGSEPMNGSTSINPSNGEITYTPDPDFNGSDSFQYTVNDDVPSGPSDPATVSITVNPVNDPPAITLGPDQVVLNTDGAQSINTFATAFDPGQASDPSLADDESSQSISQFIVSNDNNPLFTSQPAIDTSGTLTFTPASGTTGVATVDVQVQDDGGTANGGNDTSAVQQFAITVNTIHYVDRNATTGLNNGTSWTNAFLNPQSALAAAIAGDQIWVANGTYTPTATTDRTISFALVEGVAVYGGFTGVNFPTIVSGLEETMLSERDPETNPTILSGNIGNQGLDTDNSHHVVTAANTTHAATLDGFTIRDGNANASSPNNRGGGIETLGGYPVLRNLIICNNSAGGAGGGIYHVNGTSALADLVIDRCEIKLNTANQGGGLYNEGEVSLSKVIVSGNSAGTGGGIYDHGITTVPTDTTYLNVVISGNDATSSDGGGLFLLALFNASLTTPSTMTFTNVTVTGNQADDNAGGLRLNILANVPNLSTVTINNSIIWNNRDSTGTGTASASISTNAQATITHSLVQSAAAIFAAATGPNDGGNNLDADPDFEIPLDPSTAPDIAGNFRLIPNSPAGNAGNNALLPAGTLTDLDDTDRIKVTTVDLGPYEKDRNNRIYVFDVATSGSNNGTSWSDAFTDLQAGIAAASPGDEVWVAGGPYTPTSGTDRTISFLLKGGVYVYGGFLGTSAERLLSDRFMSGFPPRPSITTILSGDIGTPSDTSDNSLHVVKSISPDVLLDGFTIQDGNANMSTSTGGGGIDVFQGDGIFRLLTIKDCLGSSRGGGVRITNASPHFDQVIIQDCYAPFGGGGMYLTPSGGNSPKITNTRVCGNTTDFNGGGGLASISGPPGSVFINVVVSGNSGGGIWVQGNDTSQFINVTVTGNHRADEGSGWRSNFGGGARLENCIVWNNGPGQNFRATNPLDPASSHNLIEGNVSANASFAVALTSDPLFLSPVEPAEAPTCEGDFGLVDPSLALDAGDNTVNTTLLDIRGQPRISGSSAFNQVIDLGAVEGAFLFSFEKLYRNLNREDDDNNDGYTNFENFHTGTDPLGPYDPDIAATLTNSGGTLVYTILERTNDNTTSPNLQMSTNLVHWLSLTRNVEFFIDSEVILRPGVSKTTFTIPFDPTTTRNLFIRNRFGP